MIKLRHTLLNVHKVTNPTLFYLSLVKPLTNEGSLKPYKQSGFNLVELIVTVAILAIIATIAAPAIMDQLASMEAKRIKNQLESTLKIAKAESFIRRQNLLVCLSDAGGRCHRDSDQKLLLFVDNNNNKHFDAQIDLLVNEETLNPKYSTLSLRVGNQRHYTKFWGDSGKPRGHFGHIKYCPSPTYSQAMYQISFNQNGNITYKPNDRHPTGCV
ncbi:GspH/FimT family pseudopilin [uncultured Psychrobacter sp.]|uniref:GspH/FimT family pseudopilin n=1 Tax=uncultured Psychrobacter sp. TaxID=259303 RepID=UPI00263077C7|nr:GspH/FimT family pseudopilin [uncultured Psychrobacter sp.]